MKTIKMLLIGLILTPLLATTNSFSQETSEEEFKPVFLTVTTAHRTSDQSVDFSDWKETEIEYFKKVTMKNELIIASGYFSHYFTPDNSEVKLVSVYQNWADIEKSNEITTKLIEEGWPDEDERKAFFEKRNSYYTSKHSDEIYASTPYNKPLVSASKEPLIYYVKVNQRGQGGSGFKEYFENITMKNRYIKGYYTHVHRWGADSNEALEVFVYENFADIKTSIDEDAKLEKAYWTDEEKSKDFFEGYSKLFNGHGDYIYTNVPELAK